MNKYAIPCLLLTFLTCIIPGHFVQAQTDDDYKAEIMQHIVDPCFRHTAEKSEHLDIWSVDEAVEMMKLLSPGAVDETLRVTLPVVREKPLESRMKIYKLGLDLCIKGAGK